MNKIKAGCIVKTRFADALNSESDKNAFRNYIDYIDRDDATRNNAFSKYDVTRPFQNYNDYMGNPEKSSGLFTEYSSSLGEQQIHALKEGFNTAYENGNILWQTVVSFDNRFLEQLGVYDKKTGTINEQRLQNGTRAMMREALKRENITDTAIWSGAVHYNTDNIHIHIAYTEPINTRSLKDVKGKQRPDGYFKKGTVRSMKSKMVNHLLEYDFNELDKLVRKQFVQGKREHISHNDIRLAEQWFKVYHKLPKDTRQWKYNMNSLKEIRPLIDKLSKDYLINYHSQDYHQFYKDVLRKEAIYKTAYGANSQGAHYSKNKLDDLYTRMGNAVLNEMRTYHNQSIYQNRLDRQKKFKKDLEDRRLTSSLGRLKSSLSKSFKTAKENEYEYEKLQHDIEMSQ